MTQSRARDHIVITGTSTGIGAACALRLAGAGFSVFAGVRRVPDAEALAAKSSGEITPLLMDITDAESIVKAVTAVEEVVGDRGIAGLVNNAGVVRPGPLEFQPMDDFRAQLEVNLFGQIAVTQAFLRLELREWGIQVSLVDPGGSTSAIFGKTLAAIDDMEQGLHDRGVHDYDADIASVRTRRRRWATIAVVPDPAKGSRMRSPGREVAWSMWVSMDSGFSHGCLPA